MCAGWSVVTLYTKRIYTYTAASWNPTTWAVRSHRTGPTRDGKTTKQRPLECEPTAQGSDFSCQHCTMPFNSSCLSTSDWTNESYTILSLSLLLIVIGTCIGSLFISVFRLVLLMLLPYVMTHMTPLRPEWLWVTPRVHNQVMYSWLYIHTSIHTCTTPTPPPPPPHTHTSTRIHVSAFVRFSHHPNICHCTGHRPGWWLLKRTRKDSDKWQVHVRCEWETPSFFLRVPSISRSLFDHPSA